MPSQNEIRQTITSTIVENLKSGQLPPWRRPWALDKNAGNPADVVSKRSYRGISPLILGVASIRHNLRSKWWATFNQWKELGGSVMKRPDDVPPGKWGTSVIYWQKLTRTVQDDDGEDEEQRFFFCRMYTVLNINLDGIDKDELWHLHNLLRQHPVAEARRWFPDRPRGYLRAARTLIHDAANKATAMQLRAEGNVATAMIYEAICDRLYKQLPEFARW